MATSSRRSRSARSLAPLTSKKRSPGSTMHVLAVEFDLRVPTSQSLKQKRAAIRPLLDGIRHRFPVAVAETDHQDVWQRAAVGVAAVSPSASMATSIVDEIERFVWSFDSLEVLSADRQWMEQL